MMFAVGVSDHIMIAHSFADPFFGAAQRMHGATYAIELEVRAPSLGPHHVVMDIGALRGILRRVLDEIDMQDLDQHPAFPRRTSTTERIAEWVAGRVSEEIARLATDAGPAGGASLRVVVRESPVAYAACERTVP
jgi:6-pyruvoyltetrahydropterin/6-carboxytetrahydropterin synthase